MAKQITRIVLTGGPAAGKTTLISRILKEFKSEDGWKVITVPETATELISGFGFGPFSNVMSMEDFQYFVVEDQLHKERLALRAAETVPEEKVLVIYDRAVPDDNAYVSDEHYAKVLARFGLTPEEIMGHYDAVLHLVSCAKGAEYAFNYGNAARYESIEDARALDDRTLLAWKAHHSLHIIDNSVDFEDKIERAIAQIYRILGQDVPEPGKTKFLVSMPDRGALCRSYGASPIEMMQTYLLSSDPEIERRIRQLRRAALLLYAEARGRGGHGGSPSGPSPRRSTSPISWRPTSPSTRCASSSTASITPGTAWRSTSTPSRRTRRSSSSTGPGPSSCRRRSRCCRT